MLYEEERSLNDKIFAVGNSISSEKFRLME